MRRISFLLFAIAAALAATGWIVGLTRDDSVLVPSPDHVAASFFRQLKTGRYAQAAPYLSRTMRDSVTARDLKNWAEGLGEVKSVHPSSWSVREHEADAVVRIESENQEKTLRTTLIRENGLWKIQTLPELDS